MAQSLALALDLALTSLEAIVAETFDFVITCRPRATRCRAARTFASIRRRRDRDGIPPPSSSPRVSDFTAASKWQILACVAAVAAADPDLDDPVDPHRCNVLELEKSALLAEIIDGLVRPAEDTAAEFAGTYA